MITKENILQLNEYSINDFGGSQGIRDNGLLESAIARPYQTFGGEDLYLTIYEKAAAIGESLIINHPFVDGNKRTGLLGLLLMLHSENLDLNVSDEETYQFTIDISTGKLKFDQIVIWLKANTAKK